MPWIDLAIFMALLLAVTLYGLAVSGHFPWSDRPASSRSVAGAALTWLTLVVAVAALGMAVRLAWVRLPWPAAVIGGGLVILFAPLILQLLPDRFVDGRAALITFAAAAGALAIAGWHMSG